MPPRKASAHTRFGYRNPVHVGLLGRRNAQLIIPADALRAPLNSGVGRLTIAPVFCAAVLPVVGIDAVPAG